MKKIRGDKAIKCTAIEQKIVMGLAMLTLILAGGYLTLTTQSVVNVAVQKQLEGEITEKRSSLSKMESDYIKQKNEIDLKMARAKNFVEPTSKVYARSSMLSKKTITMNNDL